MYCVINVWKKVKFSILQVSVQERRQGLKYLVAYVDLQGVFARRFTPGLPSYQVSPVHILCMNSNVFREHLILNAGNLWSSSVTHSITDTRSYS
jgi:hypothetical protein